MPFIITLNHVGSRVSSMDIWIDMIVRYVISGICDTKSWWKWFWLGVLTVRLASLITYTTKRHKIQISRSELRRLKFSVEWKIDYPISIPIQRVGLGFGDPKFGSQNNLFIYSTLSSNIVFETAPTKHIDHLRCSISFYPRCEIMRVPCVIACVTCVHLFIFKSLDATLFALDLF